MGGGNWQFLDPERQGIIVCSSHWEVAQASINNLLIVHARVSDPI